jgi:hypothetical protein
MEVIKNHVKKPKIAKLDIINNNELIKPIEDIKPKKKVKVIKSKPNEVITKVDYYIEPSLTKEQNEKLQNDLIEFKKKHITESKLQDFLVDHKLKPNKSTMEEWLKLLDGFLMNHNFNYGWNK